MVGVPGKSKGCSTCRRRKKGCDQKRPTCGQCAASGYLCGGYQRDLTFVLHPASKTVEKAIFLPLKPRSSTLLTAPSLERSAIVLQCQSLFYDMFLPNGRCTVNDQFILRCGIPPNWTNVVRNWTTTEMSLELALAAFSISRVGRNRNDPRLIKESTKFYGKALKNLQKALFDPSRVYSEQTLTACLLLGLYETFEGAGGKSVGWVSHAQGAARIIELRGPEEHMTSPGHTLFLGSRLPIIYSAILRRKNTFLSDEDWLTIPWRKLHKTGLDRLVDVATQVPGLLEQFDAVRSQLPSTGQRQALQACLSLCRELQKSLQKWITTIRRPNANPIATDHQSTGPDDSYPFAQELSYENYLFLNANLIQWSTALVVSTTISEIEFLLASLGFQYTSMLSMTTAAIQEAQQCASNIAQSIPYCLWPDMGDLGFDYIQFPMTLAFQFFMKSNNSGVCAWLLEKSNEMQKRGSTKKVPRERNFYTENSASMRPPYRSVLASTEQLLLPMGGTSQPTVPRNKQSYRSLSTNNRTGVAVTSASSSTAVRMNPDFDADYDIDSDNEGHSSFSDESVHNSRQGSRSGQGGLITQPANNITTETDDFTFVTENPARGVPSMKFDPSFLVAITEDGDLELL